MAYHFQSDSTVESNVRRILGERLEKGHWALTEQLAQEPSKAIHSARKRLKEARSVLRLIHKSMNNAVYLRGKDDLRETSKRLAPARDGAVYLDTLNQLVDHNPMALNTQAFTDLQTYLREFQQAKLYEVMGQDEPIDYLKASLTELQTVKLKKSGWKAIGKNLKHLYQQGQKRFEVAYDTGEDQAFHEWRKRVKDLWYSVQLLQPLWPPVMDALEAETHQLADYLGDDHDIAALRAFLLHRCSKGDIAKDSLKPLMPLMDERQTQLRQQACALGCRLYAETPKAFSNRLGRYWQVWFSA